MRGGRFFGGMCMADRPRLPWGKGLVAAAAAGLVVAFYLTGAADRLTWAGAKANADALRAVAREVPGDRLLVETDSPYLSPEPVRGKRNEPANVAHTLRRLAEVRGADADALAAATTANARRLFGLGEPSS